MCISDCNKDLDCPDHLACGEQKECVEPPCPECSTNAHCATGGNHTNICICKPDYPYGDPYNIGCEGKQSKTLIKIPIHHFAILSLFIQTF